MHRSDFSATFTLVIYSVYTLVISVKLITLTRDWIYWSGWLLILDVQAVAGLTCVCVMLSKMTLIWSTLVSSTAGVVKKKRKRKRPGLRERGGRGKGEERREGGMEERGKKRGKRKGGGEERREREISMKGWKGERRRRTESRVTGTGI